jgi:hypothetical protein
MITTIETPEDKWVVYEIGGKTLSQQLCIIKQESG